METQLDIYLIGNRTMFVLYGKQYKFLSLILYIVHCFLFARCVVQGMLGLAVDHMHLGQERVPMK